MEISAKETVGGHRDYRRVARILLDKLDGLITSRATDLGTQRKILLDVSQQLDLVLANRAIHRYDEICNCAHSCCEHERVMDPALWSRLPMELLQRVFANLPFPNICRLKLLSKAWKLSLQSSSSEFTLALKESSPTILARVTTGGPSNFWLHLLDEIYNRWHVFTVRDDAIRRLQISVRTWVHMNGVADAGLVCFVFKNFKTGLNRIFVTNPMTGVVNPLPLLDLLTHSELTMMRIVVDRNTYHYKVIVVKHALPVEAAVYDSAVKQWTKPQPSLGRIFGIAHHWIRKEYLENLWSARNLGPCAYDCRDGKYYDFEQDQEKWSGKSYTVMKDRLFVLHWKAKELAAFISEYCFPENATSWVKEKTHSCPLISWQPGEPWLTCRIHACSGFLFVFGLEGKVAWVYDLATSEWRALPPVPSTMIIRTYLTNAICELHWNIRP